MNKLEIFSFQSGKIKYEQYLSIMMFEELSQKIVDDKAGSGDIDNDVKLQTGKCFDKENKCFYNEDQTFQAIQRLECKRRWAQKEADFYWSRYKDFREQQRDKAEQQKKISLRYEQYAQQYQIKIFELSQTMQTQDVLIFKQNKSQQLNQTRSLQSFFKQLSAHYSSLN